MTKYNDKSEELHTELTFSSNAVISHIIIAAVALVLVIVTAYLGTESSTQILTAGSVIITGALAALYKKLYDKHRRCLDMLSVINTELKQFEDVEGKILSLLDEAKIPAILVAQNKAIYYNESAKNISENIEVSAEEDWSINKTLYKTSRIKLRQDNDRNIIILSSQNNNLEPILEFLYKSTLSNAIIDTNYRIIYANDSFLNLLNIQKDDNCSIIDLISDSEKDKFNNMIKNIEKFGTTSPEEFDIPKFNKTIYVYISPIELEKKLHFVCKIFDLTEHKILKINFVHAQKMQALGQLAGAIAHDFNNLLTAMIGFCDLLFLRHAPGDASFNEIMQIKQNANRAAGLVRQLLAFSRKQVLSLKLLDVNNVIVELSNLLTRLLGAKIHLSIEYGKHVPHVMADSGQFEQVIINLAVNARDAMPKGGNLTINTSEIIIDDNFDENQYHAPIGYDPISKGAYVSISIDDTGSGIPDEIINHIFEPFFSTKDHLSGTGLGLATVYGIIKQIGGHIRFRTQKNKGTSFYIFLKNAEQSIEYQEKEEPALTKTPDRLLMKDSKHKGKILIVEDEAPVRLFEVHALNNKGYDVIDTGDAETAMNYLESEGHNISMVITDVIMPGITGPEMVEKIRIKYPHIKFIFTSGYTEDSLSYFNHNEHHFLAKPFTLNELASKVKEVLSKDE